MNYKLKLIIITNSVQVFAATLITPVFALFIKGIGGGPELAGVLFGISFFATAAGNLVMIRVADAKSRDALLFKGGLLIKLAAWTLLAIHQSIPVLILAQIILGTATAVGAPSFASLVSEHLDKKKHISDWARWSLMENSATAMASVLSGFMVVRYGFSCLFIIMAVITLLSFVVSLGITKKRRRR